MSEAKEQPKQKIVNVALRVTEHPNPLPGTAAWVLQQISGGYLKVGVNKSQEPGVWLYFGPEQKQSQLLAIRDKDYQNQPRLDYFPLEDAYNCGEYHDALGVTLTDAGVNVLKQLAKKAKTLLKLHLRRGDRKAPGKLLLSVTVQE